MEALKKAYAKMILNTAKEVAARVMVAELRTRRLKADLASTKDDAVRMLLPLKQIIDSQTQEVGDKLMTQQRKRDELESQLNEAEGIILALRGELNNTKMQLDESKEDELLSQRQSKNEQVCNPTLNRVPATHAFVTPSNSVPELGPVDGNNSYLDQGVLARTPSDPDSSRNQIVDAAGTTTTLEEKIVNGKKETVSPVRRSLRKRKLKYYENIIALCGIRRSHQSKRTRQIFPLVACSNSSKVKSGKDQSQAEDETQVQKNLGTAECQEELIFVGSQRENTALVDFLVQHDDVAAPVMLTPSSRIDSVAEEAKASKFRDGDDTKHSDLIGLKRKKRRMSNAEETSLSGENLSEIDNADSSIQLVQVAEQLLSLSSGCFRSAQTAEDTWDDEILPETKRGLADTSACTPMNFSWWRFWNRGDRR